MWTGLRTGDDEEDDGKETERMEDTEEKNLQDNNKKRAEILSLKTQI